jgi:hypothetical protein
LLIFSVGSCVFAWAGMDLSLPTYRLQCSWAHRWLVDWGGGLASFLPGLALNCDPPNFYLLSSWDYRCEPPYLALYDSLSALLKHNLRWAGKSMEDLWLSVAGSLSLRLRRSM